MDSNPFFSIVIPTKNRHLYLRDSIKSVLLQNFNDFELIVSDNFNDHKTKDVVNEFVSDSKLKYYRTEYEMNMLDHWEFATTKATGKYVIVLMDRKLLYKNSLLKIYKILLKHPEINVCSFGVKTFDDIGKNMGWSVPIGKTQIFDSIILIENFINKNIFNMFETFDCYYPKTLNGIYKNDFAKKVRNITGKYFNNTGVSTPDFSSCFINLSLNKSVLYIGKSIILTQGEHISNGRRFGNGDYKNYLKTLNINELYRKVPFKLPFIYNLLVNDFLEVKEKFKGNIEKFTINWENYYITNYYEFLVKKKAAIIDKERLNEFYNEFEEALNNETDLIKKNLKPQMILIEEKINFNKKKSKLRNINEHFRDFINHRFSKYKIVNFFMKYRFKNALEAAGFKN